MLQIFIEILMILLGFVGESDDEDLGQQ